MENKPDFVCGVCRKESVPGPYGCLSCSKPIDVHETECEQLHDGTGFRLSGVVLPGNYAYQFQSNGDSCTVTFQTLEEMLEFIGKKAEYQ